MLLGDFMTIEELNTNHYKAREFAQSRLKLVEHIPLGGPLTVHVDLQINVTLSVYIALKV
jgi:hypothetical protein